MRALYALHGDPESAQRSVDNLKAVGIPERDIVVMSSVPLAGHAFFERDRKSLISLVAVLAGVAGAVAGIALTSLTQISWPLNTGGMPIVSIWPNLIVIFEMTMFSAILATVIALFITSGLRGRLPALYDPEVSNGKILIGVAGPPAERLAAIEEALHQHGELKRLE